MRGRGLARKLELFQRRQGERRAFVATMQDLIAGHRSSPEMLEFLSELFNSSNREKRLLPDAAEAFDLYLSTGNFQKAGECLDRAADVDPYERGHQKRLESLRGKIPDDRFKVIASRLSQLNKSVPEQVRPEEPTLGAAALQDLMLQAEIWCSTGCGRRRSNGCSGSRNCFRGRRTKRRSAAAVLAAGITPRYAGSAPGLPAQTAAAAAVAGQAPGAPAAVHGEQADVSSFTRVAEITRKLYHQNNANAVLATAAHEMGSQWNVTRCVAAMRKPGLPPTAVQQFHADGTPSGESPALASVITHARNLRWRAAR